MSGPSYPRPLWRVTLSGEDITRRIKPRLISLTLTDNRGLDADQLDITLSDHDGRLDIPTRKARIHLALGWSDTGLVDKGSYTVDEVEHSGPPDILTIRARSADLRGGITTKKERSWHKTTVGAIVRKIADENDLQPGVAADLENEAVGHLDQTAESDANLLTRLAGTLGATATIKAGRLLFFRIGQGMTVSGLPLDRALITRSHGDRHSFKAVDRDAGTAVRAYYQDVKAGEKQEVIVKREKDEDGEKVEHSGDNTITLRHTYASKANATRAANAALDKAARGVSTFSLTLARGRPDLFPELPARLSGWKPSINGSEWLIDKVIHQLSSSGLVTNLELELRLGDNDEAQLEAS